MRISISAFGPINHFEFDLTKDVVVTFGDNNIGKSYAMQVVYLLLKNLREFSSYYTRYYRYGYYARNESYYKEINRIVNSFASSTDDVKEITSAINDSILADMTSKFLKALINSCNNTFGNFEEIQRNEPKVELQINKTVLKFNLGTSPSSYGNIYTFPTSLKRSNSNFHKSRKTNQHFDIYYYNDIQTTTGVVIENIEKERDRFARTLDSNVGDVYFLPASRSGIYSGMSAFSSIIAELSKSKAMLTQKIELPGISEPISDYFLLLSNIRGGENDLYSSVYKKIESDILKGKVNFNRISNTLVYTPDGMKHEFEMTEVSSMVSEISPIVAFMKYIISSSGRNRGKAKPIVFIEEPEAHLHPKNQIKLVEYFCELKSLGIQIVISSHSNYIFNKLNNQLLKGVISPQNYSAILLESHSHGSISAFMEMDELGVSDSNFLDVSQELYNEREAIIEAWNDKV